jgi:hypothetical protein
MLTQTGNDQLLIHYFQDSLSGAALRWYMGLESSNIRSFNDLGEAFVKQYKYNVDMAPDRDQLKAMSQKEKETFKEYAQRWRELAAQIMPPLEEKEMTKIFLKTLSSFYYERMIANAPLDFTEMVNMGMRLEEGVREGRLTRDEGSSAKRYESFAKKKEGEAHAVSSHVKRRPFVKRKIARPVNNQHQVAHIAPVFREAQHYQQPQTQQYHQQQQRPQQQAYQPRNNNNNASTSYERKRVTFDPIPMTYAELYPSLIDRKLITPRDPPAVSANP